MPLISRTASVTVRITAPIRPNFNRRKNSATGASAKASRIESAKRDEKRAAEINRCDKNRSHDGSARSLLKAACAGRGLGGFG